MPGNNRSIGSQGQQQGGPHVGNDISRDITREMQADDTATPIVKNKDRHAENPKGAQQEKATRQHEKDAEQDQ